MFTVKYIDYNIELVEQFPTYKQARARARKLVQLGCKDIRIVRSTK